MSLRTLELLSPITNRKVYAISILFFIVLIYGTHGTAQTPTVRFVNADGETLTEVEFVLHQDRIYLPIETLKKVYDPDLVSQYHRPKKQITLKTKGKELKFQIGQTKVQIEPKAQTITLANPPLTLHGQQMVPIVFFTEVLPHLDDIEVHYNSQLQRIRIIPKTIWEIDKNNNTGKWSIIIDPGHGGEDNPGSVSQNGTIEKDVVLNVAKEIRKLSQQQAFSIHLTREQDTDISHMQRTQAANKNHGKLFISLHCNNSFSAKHKGMRLYINNPNGHPRFKPSNQPILWRNQTNILTQSNYLKQSQYFANVIQQEINFLSEDPIVVSEFPITIIKDVRMPAVLLELGYLSNIEDATRLSNPEHITELANAIIQAIQKWNVSINMATNTPEQEIR